MLVHIVKLDCKESNDAHASNLKKVVGIVLGVAYNTKVVFSDRFVSKAILHKVLPFLELVALCNWNLCDWNLGEKSSTKISNKKDFKYMLQNPGNITFTQWQNNKVEFKQK